MERLLVKWLKSIGNELAVTSANGNVTNDERLARLIWQRAIGYEIRTEHEDGTYSVRIHDPDPRAQQFIFERREGKFTVPEDEGGRSLGDKIDEIMTARVNALAESITEDDGRDDRDTPDTDDTVSA